MKNRYLLMARDYLRQAGLKEQAHADRRPATVEESAVWAATMTSLFSAPWQVVEIPDGFAVNDATGQQLAVFYGLAEPNAARQTDLLTIDEARQMAVDFAKLSAVAGLRLAEMPTVPKSTLLALDERAPAPLVTRPRDPRSNHTKVLIAIAIAALPAGYFMFRNFDRAVHVAVVPQASVNLPPVELSSEREADAPSTEAPSTNAPGITVEGRAEPEVQPEVQTAPLPPPRDTKPTEGEIQAAPHQKSPERGRESLERGRELSERGKELSERGKESFAASRDDLSCLPSASAVRQNHPGAWPSWTLRAPGHENTICWYAATRTTSHHH